MIYNEQPSVSIKHSKSFCWIFNEVVNSKDVESLDFDNTVILKLWENENTVCVVYMYSLVVYVQCNKLMVLSFRSSSR